MGALLHFFGTAAAPPSPLRAIPNVTAHPSTASVPTSCYSMWYYNSLCPLKGLTAVHQMDRPKMFYGDKMRTKTLRNWALAKQSY